MEAHGLRPTPRNNRCRGQPPARQLVRYLRKRDKLNQGLVWSSDSSLWRNQLKKKIITSFGQNQGLVWSSDSSLWGNQLKKKIIITSFGTEPRPCMVLGPKPMGETNYLDKKRFEFRKMGYLIKNVRLLHPRLKHHKRLRPTKV